jgi:hypothetical protein
VVDLETRAVAADLLERFLRFELTNDQLEKTWPSSPDRAIDVIRRAVWTSYDDEHAHRGPIAKVELVERCARFLRTSVEYVGPGPRWWQVLLALPISLLTLGHVKRLIWPELHRPEWPFPQVEKP